MRLTQVLLMMLVIGCGAIGAFAAPLDPEMRERGRAVADGLIAYLSTQQNPETGEFGSLGPGAPAFPAITGLVVDGMLMDPRIDASDPRVSQAIQWILSHVKEDGSIHDGMLPSYNTAICVSALVRANSPRATLAARSGVRFLRGVQYHEASTGGAEAPNFNEPVDPDHPYYGGVGYGKHGRPDLSNLGFFLQAMHDAGVASNDEAIERAMVFLSRVQMLDETNDMAYADASNQGGFIYATVPNLESVDGRAGQSQAGTMTETNEDGGAITRLRSYGSMTYVGFKSLIFADLPRDDPRIVNAWRWIEQHYTLEENPGMGDQGYYYFLGAMGRALEASGHDTVRDRQWRVDLIEAIESQLNEDGSLRVRHERWMESNQVLTAAYALIAIQNALQ